jgi:hypothetical protein
VQCECLLLTQSGHWRLNTPDLFQNLQQAVGMAKKKILTVEEFVASMKEETKDMRYCGSGVPKRVPAGRVLAHNHVQHTIDQADGVRGFRCWTWPKDKVPRNFKPCKCGWAGLPHYRAKGETKRLDAQRDRCLTAAQLARL